MALVIEAHHIVNLGRAMDSDFAEVKCMGDASGESMKARFLEGE